MGRLKQSVVAFTETSWWNMRASRSPSATVRLRLASLNYMKPCVYQSIKRKPHE